jgi:hypothetical protein
MLLQNYGVQHHTVILVLFALTPSNLVRSVHFCREAVKRDILAIWKPFFCSERDSLQMSAQFIQKI